MPRRGAGPSCVKSTTEGRQTAPYLAKIVAVFAAEARTHFLRRFDSDLQSADSVRDGVDLNGVSTGGRAKRRVVAAGDTSFRASDVVSFALGWDGVSYSLLQPRGEEDVREVGVCDRNGGWKFSCVVDWVSHHFYQRIVWFVGNRARADGDFGNRNVGRR